MFADFIKHYNIIRSILRDVFLYGCFSREGLEDKRNLSSRKISYEIRRIQQYIEEEYIRTDRDGRYKLLSLTYDSVRNTDNFLVKTYMTRSFTKTDLLLYFYLLMCLNQSEDMLCFKDIEDLLIGEGHISYDDISSKTIERKLDEMNRSLGVLKCNTFKRTKYYGISEDMLRELTDDEVIELYLGVSLYKNILFPVTAGYFCEQTLRDYILYERKIDCDFKDYFQYRNLHFHSVIEEGILCKLLGAIHKRKLISLEYNLPETKRSSYSYETIKPFKIRYDAQCGRFYLVSFNNKNKCIISRLDRIEDVNELDEAYEIGNLNKLYKAQMKYSWSSVPLGGNRPQTIKLEIRIEEPKENFIIDRIRSEALNGLMEKIENGIYHFSMEINDGIEMVPWLRSYTGYIKILRGGKLDKKLYYDWKEMLEGYGAL